MDSPRELLLGRLAVSQGFVSREQLDECIQYQKKKDPGLPVGRIMVQKGFLAEEQLDQLLNMQRDGFHRVSDSRLVKVKETTFGQVAIRLKLVTQEVLYRVLRDQELESVAGRNRRLGEMLVECGALTERDVDQILLWQKQQVVICRACGAHFNVERMVAGSRFRCGKCRAELRVPGAGVEDGADQVLPEFDFHVSGPARSLMDLESLEPMEPRNNGSEPGAGGPDGPTQLIRP